MYLPALPRRLQRASNAQIRPQSEAILWRIAAHNPLVLFGPGQWNYILHLLLIMTLNLRQKKNNLLLLLLIRCYYYYYYNYYYLCWLSERDISQIVCHIGCQMINGRALEAKKHEKHDKSIVGAARGWENSGPQLSGDLFQQILGLYAQYPLALT